MCVILAAILFIGEGKGCRDSPAPDRSWCVPEGNSSPEQLGSILPLYCKGQGPIQTLTPPNAQGPTLFLIDSVIHVTGLEALTREMQTRQKLTS